MNFVTSKCLDAFRLCNNNSCTFLLLYGRHNCLLSLLLIFISNKLSHSFIDNFGSVFNERTNNLLFIDGMKDMFLLTGLGNFLLVVLLLFDRCLSEA